MKDFDDWHLAWHFVVIFVGAFAVLTLIGLIDNL